jgi:hypothetical protein
MRIVAVSTALIYLTTPLGFPVIWPHLLGGTYVSVEPFHLFRYLDEQSFRFNNRTLNDGQRFDIASRAIIGKRLTFAQVTGKAESRPG